MQRFVIPFSLSAAAMLGSILPVPAAELDATRPLQAVPFQDVSIDSPFWNPRLEAHAQSTVEANLYQCEITGRIQNFAVAAGKAEGKHQGFLFNDSDVYKVLEGIAYTLAGRRDKHLEKRADEIIELIEAAQQPDGYLNTYYTLVEPQARWRNIAYGHELYCAGHLMEAAVAYYQATGKRRLLDVACRLADHIDATFGPGKKVDTSGHEEIELALVKLYRATQQPRYLELARFFIDVRGRADLRPLFGEYAQDHLPVREQTDVVGHAVRAMYLFCGMIDVASATADQSLLANLERIWQDITERKMYVTGGIGSSGSNEGFTQPYDLPNDAAYAETCAAIGLALWNHRMFLLSGDGKYADVLERAVYNGLLSGVSLSGDRFFYTNPLASRGQHERVPWFACACCPSNVVRYVPSIGERAYAVGRDGVWTVLYMGSTAQVQLGQRQIELVQETNYPWDGGITLAVNPQPEGEFALYLRIPAWCEEPFHLAVNGERIEPPPVERGYVALRRHWKRGDVVRLDLPMPVGRVYAHPQVRANVGRVALARGPIVYCLEQADHPEGVRRLALPRDAALEAVYEAELLQGVVVIRGEALALTGRSDEGEPQVEAVPFQAIPYCTWANRGRGEMVVWLPESPELAELPGETGIRVGELLVHGSHCNPTDTLEALADGVLPASSADHGLPRMTWWDHRGTREWVAYRFARPRTVSKCAVYWFDDTGRGACRIPRSWRLLWKDGDAWRPVELKPDAAYGIAADRFNSVEFEPVTTRELRLEVELQPEYSSGILEWQVE
jgi:hypothetical protein